MNYWAFTIESYGRYGLIVPAGNDGAQMLHNKTRRGWMNETEAMRKHTSGSVYVMTEYSQKMCEMSPRQLADYIIRHHVAKLK